MVPYAKRMEKMAFTANVVKGLFGSMTNPDIISFSGGSPAREALPVDTIRQLADEKRTMIDVTHEMNFARDVADRVIYMANGLVVEDGPAKQVLGNDRSEAIRAFSGNSDY